jgi:mRNA interferase RelE/StbE
VYAFGSRQSRSGKNQRRSLRNEPKFSAVSEAALIDIILAPEAVEDLRSNHAHVRAKVRTALETHLRHEPEKTSRLQGLRRPQYRLRVGDIRVFYDLSGTTVEVLAIVAKSEVESWLAQFGNPE